ALRPRALPHEGIRHGGFAGRLPEVAGRAGRRTGGRGRARRRAGRGATNRDVGRARKRGEVLSTVPKPREAVPHPAVHAAPPSFVRKYVFSLDHKVIGKQYLFYALFMLIIGGLLATLVRYQLAWPGRPLPFMGKLAPDGMPGGLML